MKNIYIIGKRKHGTIVVNNNADLLYSIDIKYNYYF